MLIVLTVNVHTKCLSTGCCESRCIAVSYDVWIFFLRQICSLSLLGDSFESSSNCYLVTFYLGDGIRDSNLDPNDNLFLSILGRFPI